MAYRQQRLEQLSALYDGEDSGSAALTEAEKKTLRNWSLIGAAMRDELGAGVSLSIADRVAAAVANDPRPVTAEQTAIVTPRRRMLKFIRRTGFALTQAAIAASIAVVTVIGYQTWNAEDNLTHGAAAVSSLGPVNSVNLASFQQPGAGVGTVNLGHTGVQEQREALIKTSQSRELERINQYIRGYVLSTAAR